MLRPGVGAAVQRECFSRVSADRKLIQFFLRMLFLLRRGFGGCSRKHAVADRPRNRLADSKRDD